jgi:hypothetical protein
VYVLNSTILKHNVREIKVLVYMFTWNYSCIRLPCTLYTVNYLYKHSLPIVLLMAYLVMVYFYVNSTPISINVSASCCAMAWPCAAARVYHAKAMWGSERKPP